MSAFVVSKTHIDALVTSGLWFARRRRRPLGWFDPAMEDDKEDSFQAGEPWGPGVSRVVETYGRTLTDDPACPCGNPSPLRDLAVL